MALAPAPATRRALDGNSCRYASATHISSAHAAAGCAPGLYTLTTPQGGSAAVRIHGVDVQITDSEGNVIGEMDEELYGALQPVNNDDNPQLGTVTFATYVPPEADGHYTVTTGPGIELLDAAGETVAVPAASARSYTYAEFADLTLRIRGLSVAESHITATFVPGPTTPLPTCADVAKVSTLTAEVTGIRAWITGSFTDISADIKYDAASKTFYYLLPASFKEEQDHYAANISAVTANHQLRVVGKPTNLTCDPPVVWSGVIGAEMPALMAGALRADAANVKAWAKAGNGNLGLIHNGPVLTQLEVHGGRIMKKQDQATVTGADFVDRSHQLCLMQIGWNDDVPNYSRDTAGEDCPNYFLRENDGMPDWDNLHLWYRILPEEMPITAVNIHIYDETGSSGQSLTGARYFGRYLTGPSLHVMWMSAREVVFGQLRDAPYYRLQLEVRNGWSPDPIYESSIADGVPELPGWQCPENGLAIHDLVWKHRPEVHTSGLAADMPIDPVSFLLSSALHVKVGNANVVVPPNPPTPAAIDPTISPLNNTAEHFLDRGAARIDHGVNLPGQPGSMVLHTTNAADSSGFLFLQYWLFYDASESPVDIPWQDGPYHEGDVEFVQATVAVEPPRWRYSREYDRGDMVSIGGRAYAATEAHAASVPNRPPNATNWRPLTSSRPTWFVPFAATATQHYYGQTLEWRPQRMNAAPTPQQQTWIQHDPANERFKVFVANGGHATYFRAGIYRTGAWRLGTQEQYSAPGWDGVSEAAGATPLAVSAWQHADDSFGGWIGRWGYKDTSAGSPFRMTDRNGPQGPKERFQVEANESHLTIRTNPRRLHNSCLRIDQRYLQITR